MSSSSSLTPARSSTLSSNSSNSVPTDLTVSSVSASTDTEARRVETGLLLQSKAQQQQQGSQQRLQQRIGELEAEVRERDARLEEVRREAEARIEAIEASKREAIQTNVELRLALHAR